MGNLLASQIEKVINVYGLDELGGAEATWVMEVKDAGLLWLILMHTGTI